MDTSLQKYPVSDDIQSWLLKELWLVCTTSSPQASSLGLSPYFDYFSTQCQRFSRDGGIHICVNSYQGLVAITQQILIDNPTRDELQSSLLQAVHSGIEHCGGEEDRASATLDLCASLLLMAEVNSAHLKFSFSTVNPLRWHSPQTIRQAVERRFQSERELQPENPRLGGVFTACNLEHIGGMKVKWTTNIVDHLLLSDDDQTIFIFHHIGFLRHQQHNTPDSITPLFPDAFVDETLRSLALLLPQNDHKTRRWLRSQLNEHGLDPGVTRCGFLRAGERRFERFAFWHDRLVLLKQTFDESSPRGFRQWWSDRRNSVQWYTFWVAILVFVITLFFGLVQSIEGGLQVYLSWKALQIQTEGKLT